MTTLSPDKDLPAVMQRVIGLCWQGYTDYQEIARLATTTIEKVKEICESQDYHVQQAFRTGLEGGGTAMLEKPVKCCSCKSMINRVPCLKCTLSGVCQCPSK